MRQIVKDLRDQYLLSAAYRSLDALKSGLGRHEARHVRQAGYTDPRQAEFSVFSQFGEDGIIQYLLGRVPIADAAFVEIGVEDYREANTRFLLINDNWRGLVVDSGAEHRRFARRSGLATMYSLEAVTAFVTRENVNGLMVDAGFGGDIGLLSLDIDGVDYWIMQAIDAVSPRIVVLEYNSIFGPDASVTVPYQPSFDRAAAHHSHLYFGASLAAFDDLMTGRGYRLVATNSAGNNAFFVRQDVAGDLRPVAAHEAWVRSRFRESRDPAGNFTYLDPHTEGVRLIGGLPVVHVPSGESTTVAQALSLPPQAG